MKKLSKTAWLVLGMGIFVIAFASLYMLYSQQVREQRQIEDNLSLSQTTTFSVASERKDTEGQLTQLKANLAQLDSELAEAKSQLDSSQESFPNSVESIEYDESLFSFAHGWDLDITKLAASQPSAKEIEGITFYVTPFTVSVRGQVGDILSFVSTIVMDPNFTTATVESVDMQVPEPLTEEEKEGLTEEEIKAEEEKRMPSATIELIIYSY